MLLLNLTLLLLYGYVYAQFGFFDMFGQQHQQHQQQQQPSGASQWASHAESGSSSGLFLLFNSSDVLGPLVSCSQYLCPDTHVCVDRAASCPCPQEQDVKCLIPDALDSDGATVVCVRGANECAEVTRLMRQFSN